MTDTVPAMEELNAASGPQADVETGHVPAEAGFSRKDSAFQATAAISVSLTFQDISYRVKLKDKTEKVILDKLNGYIKPGTFVAIMGPSGAGKTCLLNVLAGRVMKSRKACVSGQILVNGRPRDESFRRVSAYVMQDDALFSCLTVWETLWVASRLRLPPSVPLPRKMQLAESVIAELGLSQARHTLIGSSMVRGVSGGERKRTSMAVEMLSNPSLVFLDEPTSGLDSFQAQNIMACLAQLAQGGRTVVSTIHQPRSSIFALFEDLILLTQGSMVYFGKARDSVQYFAGRGFSCPELYNPADYFMDIISVDQRDPGAEVESQARVRSFVGSFKAADYTVPALHVHSMEEQAELLKGAKGPSKFASGFFTQFSTLCRRALWQVTRDKLPMMVAWFQAAVMTLVISLLFYAPASGAQQIQNMQGSLFFVCIFMAFNGIFQMIITFPLERAIITRERASSSYRVSAYYPAKIGAAAPTPETALGFGPVLAVLFSLFGGLFVNLETIPVWLRWIRYLSPVQWAFVGFTNNQFSGLTFTCAEDEPGCVTTGEQVLQNLNVENFTVGEALGCQAALIVGLHLLAYATLTFNGPKMMPLHQQGSTKDKEIET